MADPFTEFIPYIALVAVFVVVGTISYNFSRKNTSMEKDIEALKAQIQLDKSQLKVQYERDLSQIEKKHLEDVKALETEIQRQVAERKEDLANAAMHMNEVINNVQKQLDSSKADVKGLLSKIEVAYTSIGIGEKTHDELKAEINRLQSFYERWVQRVEDRIEGLRKEFLMMFTSFHGEHRSIGSDHK